ncbi:hypothetical protein HDV00_007043 [Rhizophlyctis rosea]|nr:hypothetical protein HDV00_007043 [Rhizophlyctis rosea]
MTSIYPVQVSRPTSLTIPQAIPVACSPSSPKSSIPALDSLFLHSHRSSASTTPTSSTAASQTSSPKSVRIASTHKLHTFSPSSILRPLHFTDTRNSILYTCRLTNVPHLATTTNAPTNYFGVVSSNSALVQLNSLSVPIERDCIVGRVFTRVVGDKDMVVAARCSLSIDGVSVGRGWGVRCVEVIEKEEGKRKTGSNETLVEGHRDDDDDGEGWGTFPRRRRTSSVQSSRGPRTSQRVWEFQISFGNEEGKGSMLAELEGIRWGRRDSGEGNESIEEETVHAQLRMVVGCEFNGRFIEDEAGTMGHVIDAEISRCVLAVGA